MEITILIGNGFDLNLGLKTAYKDFLMEYVNKECNANLRRFKDDIANDLDNWSDAEAKFGEYTTNFEIGQKELFMECHDDFINELANYLIRESRKISVNDDICSDYGRDFQNLYEGLNSEEQRNIKKIFNLYLAGDYKFNFLIFNYTLFINHFSKSNAIEYNNHIFSGTSYKNRINEIRHIHGTIEKEMSLGLNDISQINNIELFQDDKNDIGQLVKQLNNKAFGEFNDERGHEMINRSQIIYVYGMSLGKTDALWWQRIGTILSKNVNNRLILHNYSKSANPLLSRHMSRMKEECKKKFMSFQSEDIYKKINIDEQIIVTNGNLFKSLKNSSSIGD